MTPRRGVGGVSIRLEVGSAQDPSPYHGAAHFVEHLLFAGTRSDPRGSIFEMCESYGGFLNARTFVDHIQISGLFEVGGAENVLRSLGRTLREIAGELDEGMVDRERGIIQREMRDTVLNTAYPNWDGDMLSELYRGTMYEHPVIGTESGIEAMSRQGAAAFFKDEVDRASVGVVVLSDDPRHTKLLTGQSPGEGHQGAGDPEEVLNVKFTRFDLDRPRRFRRQSGDPATIIGLRLPPAGTKECWLGWAALNCLMRAHCGELQRQVCADGTVLDCTLMFRFRRLAESVAVIRLVRKPDSTYHQAVDQLLQAFATFTERGRLRTVGDYLPMLSLERLRELDNPLGRIVDSSERLIRNSSLELPSPSWISSPAVRELVSRWLSEFSIENEVVYAGDYE